MRSNGVLEVETCLPARADGSDRRNSFIAICAVETALTASRAPHQLVVVMSAVARCGAPTIGAVTPNTDLGKKTRLCQRRGFQKRYHFAGALL